MESMKPKKPKKPVRPPPESGWPEDLGKPSITGAQNGIRFAFFPGRRRLVIDRNGNLSTYDTGDHLIRGVLQIRGKNQTLEFTSQLGPVNLDELKRADA